MHEIVWVRDLMGNWASVLPEHHDLTPFYRIALTVNRISLLPNPELLQATWEDWPPVERELVVLWSAWCAYIETKNPEAIKCMRKIARRHPDRPEPCLLLACVALLQQKRAPGRKLLERALKLDRDYRPACFLLQRFEKRNKPVLPFLQRGYPLNIWLGKLRHRWQTRSG